MKKILLFFFLLSFSEAVFSQATPPFYKEIESFKRQDSTSFPAPGGIVFVGSSSFKMWKDVTSDFPAFPVINRGFGGSSLPDAIRYANDIVLAYKPRQVIIYCGENDFTGAGVTADTVVSRFKTFFGLIRQGLPDARISFVSFKPSPSRLKYMPEMKCANAQIRDYLQSEPNTDFIDIFPLMLDAQGTPRPELYLADRLHMTRAGYDIWRDAIRPYLSR